MDPFSPDILSPDPLSSWETSVLRIGLWSIGVLTGVLFLLVLLLRKSKKAKKISIFAMGIPILLLILWSWLYVTFDAASIVGWRNGILAVLTFIVMGIILWVLSLKVLILIETHGTMRKFSIWALIVACLINLVGSLWLIFNLFLSSP